MVKLVNPDKALYRDTPEFRRVIANIEKAERRRIQQDKEREERGPEMSVIRVAAERAHDAA